MFVKFSDLKKILSVNSFLIFVFAIFVNIANVNASIPDSTALLIIDTQNFYFEGGKLPLENPIEASLNAKKLLEKFRKDSQLVIHIQHTPTKTVADMKQYDIHENVKPLATEKVIQKHFANSFRDTELLEFLKKNNIKRIVICGMQTHMCVEAATRAAEDYGFECILVEDACATRQLKYEDKTISAKDIHFGVIAALSQGYAKIFSTEKFLKNY